MSKLDHATPHRAQCGWGRLFSCATDARQYEAGYSQFPEPMPVELAFSAPYAAGWFDAEHDAQQRDEDRLEQRLGELGLLGEAA